MKKRTGCFNWCRSRPGWSGIKKKETQWGYWISTQWRKSKIFRIAWRKWNQYFLLDPINPNALVVTSCLKNGLIIKLFP